MSSPAVQAFDLQCHPAAVRPAVRALQVELSGEPGRVLQLRYVLEGHIARLRIPASTTSARTDELWRHTCFEAFISGEGDSSYYELNVSPSSQWALYHFDFYRQGMTPVTLVRAPEISIRRAEYRLELDASFSVDQLAMLDGAASLRIGLAAVIESEDASLSYWALQHSAAKPDFHQAESFIASWPS